MSSCLHLKVLEHVFVLQLLPQAEDGPASLSVLTSRCQEVSFPLDQEDRATLQSMEALLFKLGNMIITHSFILPKDFQVLITKENTLKLN